LGDRAKALIRAGRAPDRWSPDQSLHGDTTSRMGMQVSSSPAPSPAPPPPPPPPTPPPPRMTHGRTRGSNVESQGAPGASSHRGTTPTSRTCSTALRAGPPYLFCKEYLRSRRTASSGSPRSRPQVAQRAARADRVDQRSCRSSRHRGPRSPRARSFVHGMARPYGDTRRHGANGTERRLDDRQGRIDAGIARRRRRDQEPLTSPTARPRSPIEQRAIVAAVVGRPRHDLRRRRR